jgi:hypothetical protein
MVKQPENKQSLFYDFSLFETHNRKKLFFNNVLLLGA